MTFADETAVVPVDAVPGDYRAEIHKDWDVGGNTNGGYLAAMAARALAATAGGRPPVSISIYYLAPATPGPVTVRTELFKAGRRLATVGGSVLTEDEDGLARPLIRVLGSFGSAVDQTNPVELINAVPPEMPAPEECVAMVPGVEFPPPMMGKVAVRLHPEDAGFSAGVPRIRGWFKLLDDEPIDYFGAIMAADAFPPTVFNANLPVAWVPTVELTVHLRALPAPGWLRCVFTSRFITASMVEEDGEVWDSTGRLVAQSRQLSLLPRPDAAMAVS